MHVAEQRERCLVVVVGEREGKRKRLKKVGNDLEVLMAITSVSFSSRARLSLLLPTPFSSSVGSRISLCHSLDIP